MNDQHLRSLPSEALIKIIGSHWKDAGMLTESGGEFHTGGCPALEGRNRFDKRFRESSFKLSYPFHETLSSPEGKPVLEDRLSEVAESLLAAYSSGELFAALEEGQPGWQKWVKSFGKSMKRKGKSLFVPLRVLLTGKLHGPDIGSSVVLLYKAGNSGVVASVVGFIPLDKRFTMVKKVDWESFSKDPPILESADAGNSLRFTIVFPRLGLEYCAITFEIETD